MKNYNEQHAIYLILLSLIHNLITADYQSGYNKIGFHVCNVLGFINKNVSKKIQLF